jgi:cell division protein FtsW
VFFKPEHDSTGAGWQIIQAHAALSQGGLLGKGLGKGIKKSGILPEGHSDFIFAVIGEVMGFIGILFVIALFVCFIYRGYLIAWKCRDPFKYYLAFGISTMVFSQAILNMAVVAGLFPVSGIPLPFFSLGGSSVFMTLIMTGLLLNISRGLSFENRLVGDTQERFVPRGYPGNGSMMSTIEPLKNNNTLNKTGSILKNSIIQNQDSLKERELLQGKGYR